MISKSFVVKASKEPVQLRLSNDEHTGLVQSVRTVEQREDGQVLKPEQVSFGLVTDTIPVQAPFVWARGTELAVVFTPTIDRKVGVVVDMVADARFPCGQLSCRTCRGSS